MFKGLSGINRIKRGLLTICLVVPVWGCDEGEFARFPQPQTREAKTPLKVVTPKFSEHLVCSIRSSGHDWQHMYRLDLRQGYAEFLGGFGGRLVTLSSEKMAIGAEEVRVFFDPLKQKNIASFQVQLHRRDGTYQIQIKPSADEEALDYQGRCAVLDGDHFLAGASVGSAV